ncbi:MAG: hypothetical protein K9W42_12330 [Candidatus Heimdallarchaeota archaeon]|nr:hypothetical protein [Candidatus Heimdallarchaeota archaeon]
MSFIKDLFRKVPSPQERSDTSGLQAPLLAYSISESDIDNFFFHISLASFTDRGMFIKSQSQSSKKNFPESLLDFLANYCAMFLEQTSGEHLVGPFPLPKTQRLFESEKTGELNLEDWYMLVHTFWSKDLTVKDQRIAARGNLVGSLFLIIYPRKYDILIMQMKSVIKKALCETTGVSKDINRFSDSDLTKLEKRLIGTIKDLVHKELQTKDATSQLQRHLEYQLMTINEKIESLYSLANASFRFIDKELLTSLGIIIVANHFDLITTLQYHIPPVKDLRDIKWRVFHSKSEIVKLVIGRLIFWFVSHNKLEEFSRATKFNRTEIMGLFLHSDLPEITNDFFLLNRMTEQPARIFKPVIVTPRKEEAKKAFQVIKQKQGELRNKLKLDLLPIPKEAAGSILSETSWFYDKLITLLTKYNFEKQKNVVNKEQLISRNERQEISSLFRKSFGEEK